MFCTIQKFSTGLGKGARKRACLSCANRGSTMDKCHILRIIIITTTIFSQKVHLQNNFHWSPDKKLITLNISADKTNNIEY